MDSRATTTHHPPQSASHNNHGLPEFLQLERTEISKKWQMLDSLQKLRFTDLTGPRAMIQTPESFSRNRYSYICPWVDNRIKLNVPDGKCDYINASPIVLNDGHTKRYIATQGPMVGQHSHLWRMVWQETGPVAVIVMLTALEPYFPRNFEDSPWTINGNLEYEDGFCTTLSLLEKTKEVAAGSTLRKLSMVVDGEEKIIWHFLFKGWPDLGVPAAEQRRALLRLIKMANSKNSVGPENPLIVHCLAGVGRSGTYIALDYLLHGIEDGSIKPNGIDDPVFQTVDTLRKQRMRMVETERQYHFIYDVLKEKLSNPQPPGDRLEAMVNEGNIKEE